MMPGLYDAWGGILGEGFVSAAFLTLLCGSCVSHAIRRACGLELLAVSRDDFVETDSRLVIRETQGRFFLMWSVGGS